MVASDIDVCGGLDNVANVVVELAEVNPNFTTELISDAHLFPDAAVRRIGWMLDTFNNRAPAEVVKHCTSLASSLSFLSPNSERAGRLDSKWNLIINRKVDPDI